jgi:hypothetical protein
VNQVEKVCAPSFPYQAVEARGVLSEFDTGERLRLINSGRNLLGGFMPGIVDYVSQHSGQHMNHTGSPCLSYLQLSVATNNEYKGRN